jgi:hydrogenase maturation protease
MLGGRVRRVLVVGCQPADVSEGIGLTPAVEAAIPRAVDMVLEVISEEVASLTGTPSRKE